MMSVCIWIFFVCIFSIFIKFNWKFAEPWLRTTVLNSRVVTLKAAVGSKSYLVY